MAISIASLPFFLFIGACTCNEIFVVNSNLHGTESELVSAVVLYRHGDRAPISSFPNDPYYNISYWPQGYGQLLKKGILRHYNLGKWLRKRYGAFLPADYSPQDITVYSTDVDRALMSAEANLAGLYPPTESQIWEDDFLWEPIPVHLMATDDPVFALNVDCPKYNKLEEELETSDAFKDIYKDNSEFLDQLTNLTGMTVSTVRIVRMIFEVLYIYRNYDESYLPDWVEDIDQDKLTYLAGLGFAQATFTEELRRLRSGLFLDYLIGYFDGVINNTTELANFLMLSGHDTTISAALGGMGIFDNYPPEFASTLIWELRINADKEYFVNILYKNGSSDSYRELKLEKCSFDCAFDDFKSNLVNVTMDSETWYKECKESSAVKVVLSWSLLVMIIILKIVA